MLRLLRSAAEPEAPREPSDPLRDVVTRAAAGDGRAQRTVLVTVGPAVLKVVRLVLGARHPDVEDAFQEAMVAVHGALRDFRGECSTTHFACRVALHTAMNVRRRTGYRLRITPSATPEVIEQHGGGIAPDERFAARRRSEALRELLLELPPPQAEVLALHTMLGHTVQEVARTLDVPVDTVRSRLRAALAKLRARVQSDRHLRDALRGAP